MLRILLSLGFVAMLMSAVSAQGVNTTSRISFQQKEIDCRIVNVGEEQNFEFKVLSSGYEPVVLYRVKPDCSCTLVEFTREPIAPGTYGTISVSYTPEEAGRFSKTIYVRTNAANAPQQQLKITGFARPATR